jgi:hypothetical protein
VEEPPANVNKEAPTKSEGRRSGQKWSLSEKRTLGRHTNRVSIEDLPTAALAANEAFAYPELISGKANG